MLWKWNYETHEYNAFLIGENWNCKVIGELHETINCPHCGKELKVADAYTSCEVQELTYGLGYMVCEECSNEEWERRRKYRDD